MLPAFYVHEFFLILATKAGIPDIDSECVFADTEVAALKALIGSDIWECISNACSFNGSAQIEVTAVCFMDGLIDFFQGTDVEQLQEILQLWRE